MKICPQCKAQNQDAAKFCGMCRTSLAVPEKKGPQHHGRTVQKTPLYIAGALIVLGGAGYWSMTHQSSSAVEPSTLSITDLDHKGDVAFQEKDYGEALKRYRQAADKGDALAQNFVGWIYQNGLGTAANYAESVKWYQKASAQGFSPAITNMGWCYQNGLGVTADVQEAIKWYQKAIAQGNESAEINMGYLYENGMGVTKDYGEARKWYQMAAKNGNQEAKKDLDMLDAKQVDLKAVMDRGALGAAKGFDKR